MREKVVQKLLQNGCTNIISLIEYVAQRFGNFKDFLMKRV